VSSSVSASSSTSASTSAQSSSTSAGAGGMGGSGGEGGSGPQTISYAPTVADCVFAPSPDPDACSAAQPANTIGVDLVGSNMQPIHSYLRFEFDGQLSGKQVTSVILELTVNTALDAGSGSSGVVHEVSSFTHQSLFGTLPTAMAELAGDQGPNMPSMTVQWSLPVDAVTANGSLFLGILPVVSDGLDYDDLMGIVPPKLLVTVE